MKSFRVVRITHLAFPSIHRAYLSTIPDFRGRSYEDLNRILLEGSYFHGDAFSRTLRALGHEAYELVHDVEIVQKQWAAENAVRFKEQQWDQEILLAQIGHLKPDIVYFHNLHNLDPDIIPEIKRRFSSVRAVVVYKGIMRGFHGLHNVDLLLVAVPSMIEPYRMAGTRRVELCYYAFDSEMLNRVAIGSPKPYSFTFAGASGYSAEPDHHDRYWDLVGLMEETPLQLWVDEPRMTPIKNSLKQRVRARLIDAFSAAPMTMVSHLIDCRTLRRLRLRNVLVDAFERCIHKAVGLWPSNRPISPFPSLPLSQRYGNRCKPGAFGLELYRVLGNSEVTYNRHISNIGDSVGNMRLFQATGMGACLLTDTASNMQDLFKPDEEVVVYSSREESISKAKMLLKDAALRQRIAAAGQARVMNSHTDSHRASQIASLLQTLL